MADDPTAEAEAAPELGMDATEPAATPEIEAPMLDSDTGADTQDSAEIPEADGGEPVEVVEAQLEPEAAEPITLDALRVMPPKERIALMREQAPEVADELEYAGGESREAKLRREQGTKEATADRIKQIRERIASMPEDVTDEEINFLDTNNFRNNEHRFLSLFTEKWITSFEPDAGERETINAAAASNNIETYAATVLATAARSIGLRDAFDMDIGDVPTDSKLAQSIRDRDARKAAADAKADGLEGKPTRKRPPGHSVGEPVGTTEQHDLKTFIGVTRAARAGQITDSDAAKRLAEIKRGVVRAS